MPDRARGSIESSRGCSLVEVLVATTFLVVALLAVAQVIAVAARTNHRAKETTFATVLAQQKMEEIVIDAASGNGADFVDARGNLLVAGAAPPAAAVYSRRWAIEPLSASSADTLVVQVLVTSVRAQADGSIASRMLLPGEARLVTVRRRNAS
jgi:hypothetical protein